MIDALGESDKFLSVCQHDFDGFPNGDAASAVGQRDSIRSTVGIFIKAIFQLVEHLREQPIAVHYAPCIVADGRRRLSQFLRKIIPLSVDTHSDADDLKRS